jgi:hypothetical protein
MITRSRLSTLSNAGFGIKVSIKVRSPIKHTDTSSKYKYISPNRKPNSLVLLKYISTGVKKHNNRIRQLETNRA